MIPKQVLVTSLLLVVAVLAFASLAYQQVPVSIPYTVTQQFLRSNVRTVPTLIATSNIATISTTFWGVLVLPPSVKIISVYPPFIPISIPVPTGLTVVGTEFDCFQGPCIIVYIGSTGTFGWSTPTVSYSYTATSFIAESSTSLVPASDVLGLPQGLFATLAVVVIGTLAVVVILSLLTAFTTSKPRTTHRVE